MASNEWSGVISTTAPKYLKDASDLTIRDRLLLSLMQKRGRITYGNSSYELNWQVERAQPPVESYADGGTLNFTRHDLYTRLTLDWRGYWATDMMTEKEKEMNKGVSALINRYSRIIPTLLKSIKHTFGVELYVDGYASGNENRLCGLDSFCGAGTTVVGDIIAKPDDDYAGKATDVGDAGGVWSTDLTTSPNASIATDWPYGTGSSEYDYLSPKLVNWSSTSWGTSSNAWEDNAERAIRETINWLTLTTGEEGKPDLVLMSGAMYTSFLNLMSGRMRVVIPHKESQDLGFDAINFDGVAIHQEYGIAANTAYALNLDEMELACLFDGDQLFKTNGPDYDPRTLAWLFSVGFFGNMKFSPKHFAKLKNYAAS